eukprot:TRINITY_DN13194_c0_g1_i1.p1 TRINITY_DN13194_c0_g1~~TRINITY_DN13194_c0_g1_i1.p1  ORF type:complete len:140 (-),score=27.57 TRINITY_DN13194_c0_g1_i1:261-680(-)
MDNEAVYLPDDESLIAKEDLSILLNEGASASVAELCSRGPSATFLLGCMLLLAAALLVCTRAAWAVYSPDIAAFYREAAASRGGDSWPAFLQPVEEPLTKSTKGDLDVTAKTEVRQRNVAATKAMGEDGPTVGSSDLTS